MTDHSDAAAIFNRDAQRVTWHDQALWTVRAKRDNAVSNINNWEVLRKQAEAIKAHTLSNLSGYLRQFEQNARNNGIEVHWAADATEHNRIVHKILQQHEVHRVVKSKSMLTEECSLNPYLEKYNIEVTDTDLGERIIQLANETPSHIVLPAIHKKREEVDELFHHHLGTKRSGGDAEYLTREARKHLREKFLAADAAITGVNFAIAETGEIVICTNEGNADMGVNAAPLHIACMGIEKVIPLQAHLGVFLRLLARSATGQPVTSYSSHFRRPEAGKQLHIVIVDNGRSIQLGKAEFRRSLHCIRCGACLNTCPVYRRSGGHSYGYTIPGPIGSVLAPGAGLKKYGGLPFASTLCGSCSDVCPVKIDLHEQLLAWRQYSARQMRGGGIKKIIMQLADVVFSHPTLYNALGVTARIIMKYAPRIITHNRFNPWTRGRELPPAPAQSFTQWYKKNRP